MKTVLIILLFSVSYMVNAQELKIDVDSVKVEIPKFNIIKASPVTLGSFIFKEGIKLNQNIFSIIPTLTIPFKKLKIEFKYVWDKGRMDVFTHTDIGINITF